MSEINRWGLSAGASLQNASGYWPEGQAPSTVNNAARTIMGEIRRWNQQLNAEITATYASGAYTLTLERELTSGELKGIYTFIADTANATSSATLNINAVGAKEIRRSDGSPLARSDVGAHDICPVAYDPDADTYRLLFDNRPAFVQPATQNATGTSIAFTSIPTWARQIDIMLQGVSLDGATDNIAVQLGDSGGYETSGYVGTTKNVSGTATAWSSHIPLVVSAPGATNTYHGIIRLLLQNPSTNNWAISFQLGQAGSTGTQEGAGTKPLSAALDRVKVFVTGTPTDAFDAGTIGIVYRP